MNLSPHNRIECSYGGIALKVYDITFKNTAVGHAELSLNGLYAHISCHFKMPENAFYRILAESTGKIENLGTCLKKDDHYYLNTNIPIKRVNPEQIKFTVWDPRTEPDSIFEGIHQNQPYPYLSCLPELHLSQYQGEIGTWIKNPSVQDPQGSGLNQEHQSE